MSAEIYSGREIKLVQRFKSCLSGSKQVETLQDARLFFEAACMICQRESSSNALELIISHKNGLEALSAAARRSLSLDIIAEVLVPFLIQLQGPAIKNLGDGIFLEQVIKALLLPPTLWHTLVKFYDTGSLEGDSLVVFAWLCYEVISSSVPALCALQEDVRTLMKASTLCNASVHDARVYGYRIEKVISTHGPRAPVTADGYGPGWRHDNDFEDFRKISIYPTHDELLSKEEPYLQRLEDVFTSEAQDQRAYLDWLFRTLREDMVVDLKEEIQVSMGKSKARGRPRPTFGDLSIAASTDPGGRLRAYTIVLRCGRGMKEILTLPEGKRKKLLEDPKAFFAHDSLAVLFSRSGLVAFGSMVKLEDAMRKGKPVFGLQLKDTAALKSTMRALLGPEKEELVLAVVQSATFAYEPVLHRLQSMNELPLEEALLVRKFSQTPLTLAGELKELMGKLRDGLEESHYVDTSARLTTKGRSLRLQGAQLRSLINGLETPLAQIQGPPGTGKSFIGALIALCLIKYSSKRILVLSYTNHALDQFINDLIHVGVWKDDIVRIGFKVSQEMEDLKLENRTREAGNRSSRAVMQQINELRKEEVVIKDSIEKLTQSLEKPRPLAGKILTFLEFSNEYEAYWTMFQPIPEAEGFTLQQRKQFASATNIYECWSRGQKYPSWFIDAVSDEQKRVLTMDPQERRILDKKWCAEVRLEDMEELSGRHDALHQLQSQLTRLNDEKKRKVLNSTRIICCTTTGAAKHQAIIKTAAPDVVLVEEAGEILEAHVVAACSASVKQIILIGDHRQLRPKVNSYKLSVERGDGFDLNKSLFERRIDHGHFYTVLEEQHRSHPDISQFSRLLSYPSLVDAPKVAKRPGIRGLQHRVVFVHHEHPEEELSQYAEIRDPSAGKSKRNPFEMEMVLRTVKYLSQQGYKTENMVVLTPYLGQLSLIRSELAVRKQYDPHLNDLDSYELIRAGLVAPIVHQLHNPRLRLSTIDNYQGEESDIVIASLTRSNDSGDIGFLHARERLVVLMSRARQGIILFGNMHTLMKSKKGTELWTEYFDILQKRNWLVEGLPVRCEQHPETVQLLKTPKDFDQYCPDGGCGQKCGSLLSCGKHACQRCCHFLADHSQTPCHHRNEQVCDRGHKTKVRCSKTANTARCAACVREDEEAARRIRRDLEMETKRMERQQEHAARTLLLDDEIDAHRRAMKYAEEERKDAADLVKKQETLKELKAMRQRMQKLEQQKAQQTKAADNPDQACREGAKNKARAPPSPIEAEWNDLKAMGDANQALDDLMELIGLESVKSEFMNVKTMIDIKVRQEVPLSKERLSCSLLGNPGTGKTTVARLWGKFLTSTGAVLGNEFEETTGSKLASMGVEGCQNLIEGIKDKSGGVLFIDEAYQLSSGNSPGGKAVLDYLLAEVENLRGQVIFVLAGYDKEMETFYAHNPGLPSRFPIEMKFADYSDDELLQILMMQLDKKYNGKVALEGGTDGLYARIVARRVGRGRGKPGFGNARAIENALDRISKRQAARVRRDRGSKKDGNHSVLSKEDIIGPEPRAALDNCPAWKRLNELIGLAKVKSELRVLMDTVVSNYERELAEEPPIEFSLNRVFVGSPGTGKTTVAKLFGQVLAHTGMLSNGEVVIKNPADFVGSVLGESETKTKGILASTVGKVLVIDEAYGLYGGSSADIYKTGVIDTIVAEVQSVPGEDRCVLLLGYDDQMQAMFQNVNPGLSRRFPLSSSFVFEDFDDDELSRILDLKLKQSGFKMTGRGKSTALEVLSRARNRPNFGNGGEVDILLGKAKASHQKRRSAGEAHANTLDAVDFDEDFGRATRADTNVRALFRGDVGREGLIALLEGYQTRVRECKAVGLDPKEEVPFSFLFRGPPGTGKTTVARKMGKIYYDMGFLASAEVIDCSATDMIGSYVGHTGPKVQQLLDKALGKVLFIDEVYRLAEGHFAKEAVDELVDCVTKPRYLGKLIIILAGYVEDINHLLSVNQGMSSRFPETIDFDPLQPEQCWQLLVGTLQGRKTEIEAKAKAKGKTLDISCLQDPRDEFCGAVTRLFRDLSQQDGWASARDVKQLAKAVFRQVKLSSDSPTVTEAMVEAELERMRGERTGRMQQRKHKGVHLQDLQQILTPNADPPSDIKVSTGTKVQEVQQEAPEPVTDEPSDDGQGGTYEATCNRDAGVSDAVWEQLEKDKAAEAEAEAEFKKLQEEQKTASDERRKEIIRQLVAGEKERKRIEAEKARLMQMGVCPVGWPWIQQANGYRCAGGSHFVSRDQINAG